MLALPLQAPAQRQDGLFEADQEFAEVFITLYTAFDLVRKYETQPAKCTGLCAVVLFCSVASGLNLSGALLWYSIAVIWQHTVGCRIIYMVTYWTNSIVGILKGIVLFSCLLCRQIEVVL